MVSDQKSQYEEQIGEVRCLAHQLGLEEEFFEKLWLEDDWSFVLKLHALLEAAVADQLVARLGAPELTSVFSRLALSDRTTGKMAFVKALDLIDKKYRRFLTELSELRNVIVHDVTHTGFTFERWLGGLDSKQRRSGTEAFCAGLRADGTTKAREFERSPKFAIWVSSLCLLSVMAVGKHIMVIERDLAIRGQVEEYLNQIFGAA